jgi:phosphoserine phosphatase RsbU/P
MSEQSTCFRLTIAASCAAMLGLVVNLILLLQPDAGFASSVALVTTLLFILIVVIMATAWRVTKRSALQTSRLIPPSVDALKGEPAQEPPLALLGVIEQSPSAVVITDPKGSIVYVNPKFTELTGYPVEEVMGKNPRILQSGTTSPEKYQSLWEIISSGGEWHGVLQDKKKNGELYWVRETISSIKNPAGVITHFLAIQEDITEQVQIEEALRKSEERFRLMAAMTGEWIWEQDTSGRYVYSSIAVKNILGYEPEEVVGKHYLELTLAGPQKDIAATLSDSALLRQGFTGLINRYRHKDGGEIITESTGEPILDAKGRLIKWRGVDRDITAHVRYEDALRLRDRAIEAASVGIVISDARQPGLPIIYVNPAITEMTGYTRKELIGRSMRLLQGPDTDPAAVLKIRQALQERRKCEVVLKNYRKDGTPFWNELLIAPVHDETGRLTHFIGVQTDITELKRAEDEHQELEIAKQIQQSLLPKSSLKLEGLHIAGYCLPALQIGGDYFDYFWTQDAVDIVIADVSGHSVGAALMMAETRSTLKAETSNLIKNKSSLNNSAANILHVLNNLLYEDLNRAELFITMFYLKYDMTTGQLKYANAGHNRALLLRHGENTCEQLDAEGLILGINKDVAFEEKTVDLHKGDLVLLYTDGITEAQNGQGEFFGPARLCGLFASHGGRPAQSIIDHILKDLKAFCRSSTFSDDISMVVLKIL